MKGEKGSKVSQLSLSSKATVVRHLPLKATFPLDRALEIFYTITKPLPPSLPQRARGLFCTCHYTRAAFNPDRALGEPTIPIRLFYSSSPSPPLSFTGPLSSSAAIRYSWPSSTCGIATCQLTNQGLNLSFKRRDWHCQDLLGLCTVLGTRSSQSTRHKIEREILHQDSLSITGGCSKRIGCATILIDLLAFLEAYKLSGTSSLHGLAGTLLSIPRKIHATPLTRSARINSFFRQFTTS